MKKFRKSFRNVFLYAAAAGMTATGAAAQEIPSTQTEIVQKLPGQSNDNQTATSPIQRIAYPAPPKTAGAYEKYLKLPQCQREIGAQFNNSKDVIRYMLNPHQTPDVKSPDMSEAQITKAQRHLQDLGFKIADDGQQGGQTTRAVMEFQMLWGPISNTMEITGVIDQNTMDHMEYYARMAQRDSYAYDIPRAVVAAIRLTQFRKGEDFEYLSDLFRQESTFRPEVTAHRGTATGLGQHIERTIWKNYKYAGCNYGLEDYAKNIRITYTGDDKAEIGYAGSKREENFLLNSRKNPRFSALMTAENSQYEIGLIEHWTGMKLDKGWQKYSVHFMGVENGYFFWKGYKDSPNAKAAYAFPKSARFNKSVFFNNRGRGSARSFQQVTSWFDSKFGTGKYREQYRMAAYRPVKDDSGVRYAGKVEGNIEPTTQQVTPPPKPQS